MRSVRRVRASHLAVSIQRSQNCPILGVLSLVFGHGFRGLHPVVDIAGRGVSFVDSVAGLFREAHQYPPGDYKC